MQRLIASGNVCFPLPQQTRVAHHIPDFFRGQYAAEKHRLVCVPL
jgi:hypothetical protein